MRKTRGGDSSRRSGTGASQICARYVERLAGTLNRVIDRIPPEETLRTAARAARVKAKAE
jgi:hypothetical protein